MDDKVLAALADAIVPFVRDCMDEGFAKTVVPPELAAQVASAVRLLHESPLLEQVKEAPISLPTRIARVERDEHGNFVPVYDEK